MRSFDADGVPDDEIDAITHENAMRHFRFDPFAVRDRSSCTVGALRASAAAAGVDVAERSYARAGAAESGGPRMTKASDLIGRHTVRAPSAR